MDKGIAARRVTDSGVTSVQFLLASAMALYLFVALVNLVALQYGRGALRSAIEQAARAGALSGSTGHCVSVGFDVLHQLLGGRMVESVDIRCSLDGQRLLAETVAVFEPWTPLMPEMTVELEADGVVEP